MILGINRDTSSTSQSSGDSFILPGCALGRGASPNVFQVVLLPLDALRRQRSSSVPSLTPPFGLEHLSWETFFVEKSPFPTRNKEFVGISKSRICSPGIPRPLLHFPRAPWLQGDFLNCRLGSLGTKGKARARGSFSSQGAANSFRNSSGISKQTAPNSTNFQPGLEFCGSASPGKVWRWSQPKFPGFEGEQHSLNSRTSNSPFTCKAPWKAINKQKNREKSTCSPVLFFCGKPQALGSALWDGSRVSWRVGHHFAAFSQVKIDLWIVAFLSQILHSDVLSHHFIYK